MRRIFVVLLFAGLAFAQINNSSGGGFTPPVVASGLIGRYAMSDASGTTLPDSSGSGNNGTLVNSPTLGTLGITFSNGSGSTAGAKSVSLPVGINAYKTAIIFHTETALPNEAALVGSSDNTKVSFFQSGKQDTNGAMRTPALIANVAFSTQAGESCTKVCMASVVLDATTDRIYINDHETGTYYPGSQSGNLSNVGGNLSLAVSNIGGSAYTGTMYYALFYNRELSAAEIAQDYQAILSILGTRGVVLNPANTSTASNFVAVGDSRTVGSGGATPYTSSLTTTDTFTVSNLGVSGAQAQWLQTAAQTVDNFYNPQAPQNITAFWAGVNDFFLGSRTSQQIADAHMAFCRERRNYGWKCIETTEISAFFGGSFDATKNAVNAIIRARWRSYADALADLGADPNLGCDGCYSNATYFQDQLHPTTAGNAIIAQLISAQLNALVGATPQVSQSSATAVSVNANSTSDQNLMAFTLRAGALNVVDKYLHVVGSGIYTTQSAQTPTVTFKVKLCTVSGCGSGTVITACSWTSQATTASVTDSWYIRNCDIGTISTGSSATVIGKGEADIQIGATGGVRAPEIEIETNNAASSAIDLTGAIFVQITATFSTNAATANIAKQWLGSAQSVN